MLDAGKMLETSTSIVDVVDRLATLEDSTGPKNRNTF
jgi:hypothetical protein